MTSVSAQTQLAGGFDVDTDVKSDISLLGSAFDPMCRNLGSGLDEQTVLEKRKFFRQLSLNTAAVVGQAGKSFAEISAFATLNAAISVGAWIQDHDMWESGWYGPSGALPEISAEKGPLPEIAMAKDMSKSRKRQRLDMVRSCLHSL